MTPWRTQATDNAERTGALVLAVAGAGGSLLGPHGPELVLWILTAMGFDLLSGLLRALIRDDEDVSGAAFATGVLKKMAILLLLFPAAMLDRSLHLSQLIADGAGPTAFATMTGIMMYEGASIVRNVQAAIGRTRFTIMLIEAIDRYRAAPDPKPNRRHYDTADPEDMEP